MSHHSKHNHNGYRMPIRSTTSSLTSSSSRASYPVVSSAIAQQQLQLCGRHVVIPAEKKSSAAVWLLIVSLIMTPRLLSSDKNFFNLHVSPESWIITYDKDLLVSRSGDK